MKYLRLFKDTGLLLAILIFSSLSLGGHVSAMPAMGHEESAAMNHQSSDSSSCATQCRKVVVNKEDEIRSPFDEEDDAPNPQYYLVHNDLQFSGTLAKQKLYADSVKPPPKVPIYILYGVFRASDSFVNSKRNLKK